MEFGLGSDPRQTGVPARLRSVRRFKQPEGIAFQHLKTTAAKPNSAIFPGGHAVLPEHRSGQPDENR